MKFKVTLMWFFKGYHKGYHHQSPMKKIEEKVTFDVP